MFAALDTINVENRSYIGFLFHHHQEVVTTTPFNTDWNNLDHAWSTRYLKVIETLDESSENLQEKVNREREYNRLEEYWTGIIEERQLREELREDEEEYERFRIEMSVEYKEKKNRIISFSSHWSEGSKDLHANDGQNLSANDNIVDIENATKIVNNENEDDLYETTSTTNTIHDDAEIEHHHRYKRHERDSTYSVGCSRQNTDNELTTIASCIYAFS
ncbi:hypothetical protein C2G38_1606393 [Gigaspora rosea]|uniref:Uncharacterized protein n=1 Tax=Gigaspora rosea TaxID=44941 RepID=A0A397UZQ4_9GLOM|nr:hypothetical protein C2G38_1606393 [Gigaspora rosea]